MIGRMEWMTPAFVEIKMDAEIGSYQEDGERVPFEGVEERDAPEAAAE